MTDENFQFQTKLWQRSPNSFASTIPQPVLALAQAPTEADSPVVNWKVSKEGRIYVEFDTAPEAGDDE